MLHHTKDPICPLCEQKLTQAKIEMALWFRDLKTRYPNVHVSWSYRDRVSQEQCFLAGTTKLHYPESGHNQVDAYGNSCSIALDLFQISESGQTVYDPLFFVKVDTDNLRAKLPIFWGGRWKHLGDRDHFEWHPIEASGNSEESTESSSPKTVPGSAAGPSLDVPA